MNAGGWGIWSLLGLLGDPNSAAYSLCFLCFWFMYCLGNDFISRGGTGGSGRRVKACHFKRVNRATGRIGLIHIFQTSFFF